MLLMLLALLNGKAGGQITGADLSRVDDPILGILTGTYNPQQQQQGPDLNALSYQYRPTWESLGSAASDTYYDEKSIERIIASSLEAGMPLIEVKKQIPQRLAEMGVQAGPNDSVTQELLNLATKLDSELHDYNVALQKATTEKDKETWWSKAGISDPSLKPSTDAIMAPLLQRLATMYAPTQKSTKQKSGENSTRQLEEIQRTKTANTADAESAARIKMDKSLDVPYGYGGRPGLADMGQMGLDEAKYALNKTNFGIPPQANPFNLVNAGIGLLGGTVKGMIQGMMPLDFQDAKGRKEKYIKAQGYDAANDSNIREMEQMLVRQQAMGGNLGAGKKTSVPIRTDLLNKQRQDSAMRVAAILQQKANSQVANQPTPAMNDVMSRIMSLAIAEKMKQK